MIYSWVEYREESVLFDLGQVWVLYLESGPRIESVEISSAKMKPLVFWG